jgi:hypothetical protein
VCDGGNLTREVLAAGSVADDEHSLLLVGLRRSIFVAVQNARRALQAGHSKTARVRVVTVGNDQRVDKERFSLGSVAVLEREQPTPFRLWLCAEHASTEANT